MTQTKAKHEIIDPMICFWAGFLDGRRRVKRELETEIQGVTANLKELVTPYVDELGPKILVHSDREDRAVEIHLVKGTSRRIDPEILLSKGVSPDIIKAATKVSEYEQLRVKRVEPESD